ncbi:MAG: galactokinase [Cytophagales bacterium]|nr:galactokinase [Cytophagales bacterium]
MESVVQAYQNKFGSAPDLVVRAPGRINLIGEHTDYNGGFVFPAAVGHEIQFALGKSGASEDCSLYAMDLNARYDFKLSEMKPQPPNSWENYLMGVAAEILATGRTLEGFNVVFTGNVPRGAGMSSSAAVECGTCFGLSALFGLDIPRVEMAQIAQLAEHHYAGVMCGIMDQFSSVLGKADHAFRLDCESLDFDYFPFQLQEYSLVLCNSNVTHNLADSGYNERRQQCEEGVKILKEHIPGLSTLRHVSLEQLYTLQDEFPELIFRRCKYVLEENARVNAFAKALEKGDIHHAGELMKQSQRGMQFEYEITCPEIDFMAAFSNARPDTLGARMTGGGFGGCTINLVKKGTEEDFIHALDQAYQEKFNQSITPIPIQIAAGVSLLS